MILDPLVVYVDRHKQQIPVWEAALRGTRVTVVHELTVRTDAALVSPSLCDKYGCKAGSSNDTLGRMYVFDPSEHGVTDKVAKFLISNAVWRSDPPLLEAVERRLSLLESTIVDFNNGHQNQIGSVTIFAAVLGMWRDYNDDEQGKGIRKAAELIRRWAA